jgi:3-oxoacyl-[acyl-carrier-protein] synthase-3
MKEPVGILAAACHFPTHTRTLIDLFREEGVGHTESILSRLGIEQVPIRNGETASNMAVAAAKKALQMSGVNPAQLDVIIEYSILPQEYLVPVWNMSNKVQAEVGAGKSFVVGFSGGGSSNFLVALNTGMSLLQENEALKTALLVTGDATIPGNRVLNPSDPVTVLGDAASAVVLGRGAKSGVIIDTELWSEGENHDLCYIPGGSLIHPDDITLYRLQLDKARYDAFPRMAILQKTTQTLLERNGLKLDEVAAVVSANVSAEDHQQLQEVFAGKVAPVCPSNRQSHGHLQGTDFVLNYLSLMESGSLHPGDYVLAVSHGMGAMSGASLIRC